MNRALKLVIFDWDGTLADTTLPIIRAMQSACVENGLPVPEDHAVRRLIGYSLDQVLALLLPEYDPAVRRRVGDAYRNSTHNPIRNTMTLFADALPCLRQLREAGYYLAVATGKGRAGLDKAVAESQTADLWYATRCASECPSKPAPDMVLEICSELAVRPSESLVVGDTSFDLEMAANAGAQGIGITTGAHDLGMLRSAPHTAIISSLAELPPLLAERHHAVSDGPIHQDIPL